MMPLINSVANSTHLIENFGKSVKFTILTNFESQKFPKDFELTKLLEL